MKKARGGKHIRVSDSKAGSFEDPLRVGQQSPNFKGKVPVRSGFTSVKFVKDFGKFVEVLFSQRAREVVVGGRGDGTPLRNESLLVVVKYFGGKCTMGSDWLASHPEASVGWEYL